MTLPLPLYPAAPITFSPAKTAVWEKVEGRGVWCCGVALVGVLVAVFPVWYVVAQLAGGTWLGVDRAEAERAFAGSIMSVLACVCAVILLGVAAHATRRGTVSPMHAAVACAVVLSLVMFADIATKPLSGDSQFCLCYSAVLLTWGSRVRPHLQCVVVACVALWSVVLLVAQDFSFVLAEEEGAMLPTVMQRRALLCGCEKPPCYDGRAVQVLAFVCRMLALGATVSVRSTWAAEGKRRTDVVQETVLSVIFAISVFDLDDAQSVVNMSSEDLSPELRQCFEAVISKMRTYRAYIPSSCLPRGSVAESEIGPFLSYRRETNRRKSIAVSLGVPQQKDRTMSGWVDSSFLSEGRGSVFSSVKSSTLLDPVETLAKEQSQGTSLSHSTASVSVRRFDVKSVTLIETNLRHSLALMQRSIHEFDVMISDLLHTTIQVAGLFKGVVDDFVGDRFSISFNASKPCGGHANAAADTAMELQLQAHNASANLSVGLASGQAPSGHMGCKQMMRFGVFGELPLLAANMERVARRDTMIVCDRNVQQQIACTHEVRLLPFDHVVQFAGEKRSLHLAEVIIDLASSAASSVIHSESHEWMYELEKSKVWEVYNQAVRALREGDVAGARDVFLTVPVPEGRALQELRAATSAGELQVVYVNTL